MNSMAGQKLRINNVNSPFTEIFSLLTKYEVLPDNTLRLAYPNDEQNILRQHIYNSSDIILRGLQEISSLLAVINKDKTCGKPVENIGELFSLIFNLLEALNKISFDLG